MSRYNYAIDDDSNTIKIVDNEELIVLDFGEWESMRVQRYRALLSMRHDMDRARAYLEQMIFGRDTSLIDGALINGAISLLVRCFSNPHGEGRFHLDRKKVFSSYARSIGEGDYTKQFLQFCDARNTVIAHDQRDYNECVVGLTVNSITGSAEDIASVSVRTDYLYTENKKTLLNMISITERFIDDQMDELANSLIQQFNDSGEDRPHLQKLRCEGYTRINQW